MEHEEPSDRVAAVLLRGLAELGLDQGPASSLARLAGLVARWAGRLNLTGHRDAEAVARRLVLDAVALGTALPGHPPHSLADLGSGAGFPGLPLAILWPGMQLTSVDSRERRHHFQRMAIRTIDIRNATAIRGRAEILPAEPHQIVIAQAMASPEQALSWMRAWVRSDGWLVLPRSAATPAFEPPPGIESVGVASYQVPLGGPRRELWIGRIAAG